MKKFNGVPYMGEAMSNAKKNARYQFNFRVPKHLKETRIKNALGVIFLTRKQRDEV